LELDVGNASLGVQIAANSSHALVHLYYALKMNELLGIY
jgi:hypothetical protein